jgi:hypothetical protein
MIMRGNVVYPAYVSGGWTGGELAALRNIQKAFRDSGIRTHCEFGMTDEGSPWAAFYDWRDEFLGHVARDRRRYILICPDGRVERSNCLEEFVSVLVWRCGGVQA